MKSVLIENPTSGSMVFNYTVDGQTGKSTETDFTSSILMYVDSTSVNYTATGSKTSAETNNSTSDTVVYGTINMILQNTNTASASLEVFCKFYGTKPDEYTIYQVLVDDVALTTTPTWNTDFSIGTIPKATNESTPGSVKVTLKLSYSGTIIAPQFNFNFTGYESTSQYTITGAPVSVYVNTVFSILAGDVTLVGQYNNQLTGTQYVDVGDTVRYLTTISNSGNAATLTGATDGTLLSQVLDTGHFSAQTFDLYYAANLDTTTGTGHPVWDNPGGTPISITIDDSASFSFRIQAAIAAKVDTTNGTYYVRIDPTVSK